MQADRSAEQQILSHIEGLFQAFMRKDRGAIREGHTADWRGFQVGSRSLIRGIDAYMAATERWLDRATFTAYELLDTDVEIHGELAIVFYLARDHYTDASGTARTALIRALDIYRLEQGHWIQSGSHIVSLPENGDASGTA